MTPSSSLSASRSSSSRPPLRRALTVGLLRGLAGGVVATAAMSAVMFGAQTAGLLGTLPPTKITDRFLDLAGIRRATPRPARKALAALAHVGFGGACGALFGAAHAAWRAREHGPSSDRTPRAPLAAGVAFGTAIWAVSYAGWVPALGIMPRPSYDRPGRPTAMVLAHWVFGAALAKLVA